MQQCTGRFETVGSDGQQYTVEVWKNVTSAPKSDIPSAIEASLAFGGSECTLTLGKMPKR
jgi:hypothetical protein